MTPSHPYDFTDAIAHAVTESLKPERLSAVLGDQLNAGLSEQLAGAGRILLTGSGDSLFAAHAMRPALERWTGRLVEVRTAIELARYDLDLLDPGRDLVVALSNSGSSSRTRETVLLSKSQGIRTLGLTGSLDGPLAATADIVLHRPVDDVALPAHWGRVFLNMSEYLAALLALAEVGLAVGRVRNRLDEEQTNATRGAIMKAVHGLPAEAAALNSQIASVAEDWAKRSAIWCLGAGPSAGTAAYAAAKFHEQVPLAGIAQDLEEWAHLEYFLTLRIGRESAVVVHAPAGASFDRAEEIVTGIAKAGGEALVAAPAGCDGFDGAKAVALLRPMSELLSPFTYHLPVQLLTLHIARLRGVAHIPLRREDDRWLIRGGLVRETPAACPRMAR